MKWIKSNLRLIIAVVIALILIITGVTLIRSNKSQSSGSDNPVNQLETLEKQIETVTGMSKEDAINTVKSNFGSDNYEFKAEATNDSLYRVIVTNIVDNSEIIYFVDPTNGKAYINMDAN